MRVLAIMFTLLTIVSLVGAEELGPFAATPVSPAAPQSLRGIRALQSQPAAAFGKSVYLVAWSDGTRQADNPTADIHCARIEPKTGGTLDPRGIVVCNASDIQDHPAIAFDGTNFLVVWQDLRNGKDFDIYAARVSEEGKVLDPNGFPIIRKEANQAWPTVAFAGGSYLIAWMDARLYPVYGIYYARVTPKARVLHPQGLPLDVEDPGAITKAKPREDRWLGEKNYWWAPLASRFLPWAASNGKTSLVLYCREYPRGDAANPRLTAAVMNPLKGTISQPVKVAGGPSPVWTGKGWVAVGPTWKPGWTPRPLLGASRLSELPTETEEAAFLDLVEQFGGGYNVGKGAQANFASSAVFDGRNVLVAMQYAWRGSDKTPVYAIIMNRFAPEGELRFLDPKCTVLAGGDSNVAVNRPVLAAGPKGEVLLAYEHDRGINYLKIMTRLVREK